MRAETKKTCGDRLKRIEGQVRGIARMVEEDRYCIDILTQTRAIRAALRGVEEAVLKDHVEHCVKDAIASGDDAEQRRKVQELVTVLSGSSAKSI
jgi:CsoR family transcriptional regulator, copper-sensing transcriptional repressor